MKRSNITPSVMANAHNPSGVIAYQDCVKESFGDVAAQRLARRIDHNQNKQAFRINTR